MQPDQAAEIPLPALLSLAAGETYGVLTGTGVFGVIVFLAACLVTRRSQRALAAITTGRR